MEVKSETEKISGRFDLISLYADRQRSLDGIDRDHQSLVSVARNQDSLKTLQGAAADPNALPDLEKWIRGPRNPTVHQSADGINLSVGDRRAFTAASDQPKYARRRAEHSSARRVSGQTWQTHSN